MDSPSKFHLLAPLPHKALFFFFFFFVVLLISPLCASPSDAQAFDQPTAYQMLEKFDLPRGILPEGAQSYVLRPDGSFEVYLTGDCEFKVAGSYLLRYKKKVAGTVSAGSLTGLRGVSVRVLFLWFGVSEVARSGDELIFSVGPLSATFALSSFEECPRCRCGFDCSSAATGSLVADA